MSTTSAPNAGEAGAAELDHALLMRNVPLVWEPLATLESKVGPVA